MKRLLPVLLLFLALAGCAPMNALAYSEYFTPTTAPIVLPAPTATFTPFPVPTQIPATPTAIPTPTPMLVQQGPGKIVCPILLYHRIAVPQKASEYYVAPEDFQAQMQALKDWGYTPILPELLVKAINDGAPLPERPIIITFDDGDITVYTEAFPVMKKLGFVGVNYLVSNYLNTPGYMTTEQLKEMAAAGWEAGSHTISHKDLTTLPDPVQQIADSRDILEEMLGVPVDTFAYPFGLKNEAVVDEVEKHYSAAMGLGSFLEQSPNNLYYLWRRPVKYGWDIETFGSFLPWNTPPGE